MDTNGHLYIVQQKGDHRSPYTVQEQTSDYIVHHKGKRRSPYTSIGGQRSPYVVDHYENLRSHYILHTRGNRGHLVLYINKETSGPLCCTFLKKSDIKDTI